MCKTELCGYTRTRELSSAVFLRCVVCEYSLLNSETCDRSSSQRAKPHSSTLKLVTAALLKEQNTPKHHPYPLETDETGWRTCSGSQTYNEVITRVWHCVEYNNRAANVISKPYDFQYFGNTPHVSSVYWTTLAIHRE